MTLWEAAFLLMLLVTIVTNLLWYNALRKQSHAETKVSVTDWAFLASGESGDLALEMAWLRAVQRMYELFCAKQHDYGPDNIAIGSLKGVALRMGDKMSRLWQLAGLTDSASSIRKVKGETLTDTLLDLADYGIIGVLVHEGSWKSLTTDEAWGVSQEGE